MWDVRGADALTWGLTVGERTAIAWTDHTFNPWVGCERVSPACQHCYAEQWAKRSGLVEWGKHATRRRTSEANWRLPLRWDAAAAASGRKALVFCASLADVFEDRDELHPWRDDLFDLIEQTPNLIWQLLTKRPEHVTDLVPSGWLAGIDITTMDQSEPVLIPSWPHNVWIGTTVEDQQRADERIPHLLAIPAPVRFLSCEPLLGPVDLLPSGGLCDVGVDWIIVGGESGPGFRPLDLAHARSLVQQGRAFDIPVFFKQVGGARPDSGGDELDGQTIKQFPREAHR